MDKIEAERGAKALLLKKGLEEKSYEQLRNENDIFEPMSGFANYYLKKAGSIYGESNKAELATLLKFARFDLALGTTIAELVYSCCFEAPIKTWIESLISLDKVTPKNVEQLFAYKDHKGSNCLMEPIWSGNSKSAEESLIYLIELGDQHGVDMAKVLNETDNGGGTLFYYATLRSKQLALYLFKRGVKVNTVDKSFSTPSFRVS